MLIVSRSLFADRDAGRSVELSSQLRTTAAVVAPAGFGVNVGLGVGVELSFPGMLKSATVTRVSPWPLETMWRICSIWEFPKIKGL